MLSALQPSRPKPAQQTSRPAYAHQQTRATHETPHHSVPLSDAPNLSKPMSNPNPPKPRSQIEAMPPFSPAAPMLPTQRMVYDSAVRHPVFFTEQLRKPPFPIPQIASQGWSPVASGYIQEQRKADASGIPKTKL
ncbi:hypothetical protein BU26DRAFT_483872 [Trematosphaeria pertusa]|uniref:Uncharacterized protein n=1 Tax=Trematosphaeria pertusa TaxID=390896 RepID=A0A6A6IFG7_9PLEO|nr:uncharacterized protein BU26DRAFT_483872 [Trematosphaeria pertusa]KAF2248818.1 hypothetical protein BU26DRAFT_483872 [Trematosphaeria pertusa]